MNRSKRPLPSTWLLLAGCICIGTVCDVADAQTRSARNSDDLDGKLRRRLLADHVVPLDPGPVHGVAKVRLGQALFFDKILSGNRDIACATCHHPALDTGDALSLSIGVGGVGLGPLRALGEGRPFIPRNAPEVYNRGSLRWRTQFWDSRVETDMHGEFISPAGMHLPEGLESVLAVQAMFPVTSRDEMRGSEQDGESNPDNELARIQDGDLTSIWAALMARLLSTGDPETGDGGYLELFREAYPHLAPRDLGFEHAANAIAAFEATAFTFLDSPFDRYLDGRDSALTRAEKRGALLFYGKARCADCHEGSLMTDQRHHNIGVPQLGPGKEPDQPFDLGRARETGKRNDLFAFRTPPLRNVALTGPWMHNGAYDTLEAAVRHHFDPEAALLEYDETRLDIRLQGSVLMDPDIILGPRGARRRKARKLSRGEFEDLVDFLHALTSPAVFDGAVLDTIPDSVPSGLPVD